MEVLGRGGDPFEFEEEEEANGMLFGKQMHVMEGLEEEEEQEDAAVLHVEEHFVDQLVLDF